MGIINNLHNNKGQSSVGGHDVKFLVSYGRAKRIVLGIFALSLAVSIFFSVKIYRTIHKNKVVVAKVAPDNGTTAVSITDDTKDQSTSVLALDTIFDESPETIIIASDAVSNTAVPASANKETPIVEAENTQKSQSNIVGQEASNIIAKVAATEKAETPAKLTSTVSLSKKETPINNVQVKSVKQETTTSTVSESDNKQISYNRVLDEIESMLSAREKNQAYSYAKSVINSRKSIMLAQEVSKLFAEHHEFARAASLLERQESVSGKHKNYHELLAYFYYSDGKYKKALESYLVLASQELDNTQYNLGLGLCYDNIGEKKNASIWYNRYLSSIGVKSKDSVNFVKQRLIAIAEDGGNSNG